MVHSLFRSKLALLLIQAILLCIVLATTNPHQVKALVLLLPLLLVLTISYTLAGMLKGTLGSQQSGDTSGETHLNYLLPAVPALALFIVSIFHLPWKDLAIFITVLYVAVIYVKRVIFTNTY
jgi:hypothetical protein